MGRYVVAVSGASGVVYGVRAIEALASLGHTVHLVLSRGAPAVARHEMGVDLVERLQQVDGDVVWHDVSDTAASIASGSFQTDGMVVIPASLRTTAAIANGIADDLVVRAALVTLKEGRRLVVVPRETPLDLVTLENWRRLVAAGARLVPAMPGFYHQPESIDDLVAHVAGKALDQLGVENTLYRRWDPDRP